jgi:predicted CopG family antitoxin
MSVQMTIDLDEELHRLLEIKARESHRSFSELIGELAREALNADEEDLMTIEARRDEETIAFEELKEELENEGRL